jgi:hypothetical protein
VKENELVSDRTSFRLPAALIFGGQLVFIAAGIFHPGSVPANDHPAVFAEYATSAYWDAVHMGQFAGLTVMLAGFIALAFALGVETGGAAWVGRFAAAAAVITVALMGVLQAVDGVALKAAADAWFAAPAAEQPARLATLEGVRWLEWGVRSYQRSMQGLTLILLATQIILTIRLPRPIGYAMAVAGITYIVQGVVVGAEGFSSNGTIPGLLAFVLDIAWMAALVVVAWQKPRRVRSITGVPAVAS